MDERYLTKLPPEVRSLVSQVEEFADKSIGVKQSSRAARASCEVSEESATIYLRDLNEIDVEAVLHELLHIQRNWPERVPQVFAKNEDYSPEVQMVGSLDNQLEHLVIYPRQKVYGFDPTAQLNAKLGHALEGNFWQCQCAPDRRFNLLLTHLTVDFLVTDTSVRSAMLRILESDGLTEVARGLSAEIRRNVIDKERMVAAAARDFPIPPNKAQLIYFDPVNISVRRVAIHAMSF